MSRTLAEVTHRDPDTVSGSLVFAGTRPPVRSLFDYLEGVKASRSFCGNFRPLSANSPLLDAAYENVVADANTA